LNKFDSKFESVVNALDYDQITRVVSVVHLHLGSRDRRVTRSPKHSHDYTHPNSQVNTGTVNYNE